MIKVRVTHLFAPWPADVAVGSIVAIMADKIPPWALGKCEVADEGAEPQFAWEPPSPTAVPDATATAPEPNVEDAVAAAVAPMLEASEKLKAQMAEMAEAFAALRSALPAPKR